MSKPLTWITGLLGAATSSVEISESTANSTSGANIRNSVAIRRKSNTGEVVPSVHKKRRRRRYEYYCEMCGKYDACCVRDTQHISTRYLACDCTTKIITEHNIRRAQHIPRFDRTELALLLDRVGQKTLEEIHENDPDIHILYELFITAGTAIEMLRSKRGLRGFNNSVEDSIRAEADLVKILNLNSSQLN